MLAGYKFVAKFLRGYKSVLEVGCGDAFLTRMVRQEIEQVVAVNIDPVFIDHARKREDPRWRVDLHVHDILVGTFTGQVGERFDAAYCIDVFEHIERAKSDIFIGNIRESIKLSSIFNCGIPSLESRKFGSPASKAGHVNYMSGMTLKKELEQLFEHVFLFSMNDELIHTGYKKMAHYLFCLCVNKMTRIRLE